MTIFAGHRSGWMRGLIGMLLVAAVVPSLAGCGSGKPSGATRTARAPGSKIDADELVGRWRLQYVQVPVELDFAILEIEHKDDKFNVKLLSTDPRLPTPVSVKTVDIKEDGQVRLEISAADVGWSFQGRLDGESIWGTVMVPQFQLAPAKMQRTKLDAIDPKTEPEKISTLGDFMGAQNASDRYVALDEFVRRKESNRSPLLIEAYASLATYSRAEKLTLEKVKAMVANFHKAIEIWGPRMAPRVELEVGRALAFQGLYPDYAKELLVEAEKQISADYPLEWRVQVGESWLRLGNHEHALKLLTALREQDGANIMLNMVYAQAQEESKNIDEAIKAYSNLAVLPQLEVMLTQNGARSDIVLPSEAVARLWKEKHGDTKGLDDYLRTSYNEQMKLFVPKHTPAERPANGKVSLIELFTGAACMPCVPADIACEALRAAYSPQELVVIKYHAHVPMPDPLASDATMRRFESYAGRGTPMMIFNSEVVQQAGGLISQAAPLIAGLQAGIDAELKKTATVDLKLSATRQGDDIKIKAVVNGIATSDNDPRLILVLLENEIPFHAQNGIRVHNSVARGFTDGPIGIKLTPGKETVHEPTISIAKLKEELAAHTSQIEKEMGRGFPAKPLELTKLQVAAIVQNNITKSLLQVGVVDVVAAQP